jgi:hypothetical protein
VADIWNECLGLVLEPFLVSEEEEDEHHRCGHHMVVAHGPDAFRGGFQPLISLDVTALVELNVGFIETDSVAVCLAAGRDEKIRALDSAIAARVIDAHSNAIA